MERRVVSRNGFRAIPVVKEWLEEDTRTARRYGNVATIEGCGAVESGFSMKMRYDDGSKVEDAWAACYAELAAMQKARASQRSRRRRAVARVSLQ